MTPRERTDQSLTSSFERYLQNKGKGRGGGGGNYRRNAAREFERFAEWTAGDRGNNDWIGIVPDDVGREPTSEDLDKRVFREYARYLAGDRGLKQNTVQTYYRYISAWCGWCLNEGYLEAHYAQRASVMASLRSRRRSATTGSPFGHGERRTDARSIPTDHPTPHDS